MKNIRKMIAAITMMMVLMVGTSFAGIYMSDSQEPQPCTSAETSKGGVILSDVTGVIVHLTGVIVHLSSGGVIVHVSRTETPVDCGVIVH